MMMEASIAPGPNDGRAADRQRMVDEIIAIAAESMQSYPAVALDPGVLSVMRRVPRHEFVPGVRRHAAYRDSPLDIGDGQTISQPFMVALMTSLLHLKRSDRVLEIGTGCGYQTAILAELAGEVFTVEIVESLAKRAAATLTRMGYANVRTRIGDGNSGWPEAAPFDCIIVTAAPDRMPDAIVAQLKEGGRMVIPVGNTEQTLKVVTKQGGGQISEGDIMPVRFVPFTRDAG